MIHPLKKGYKRNLILFYIVFNIKHTLCLLCLQKTLVYPCARPLSKYTVSLCRECYPHNGPISCLYIRIHIFFYHTLEMRLYVKKTAITFYEQWWIEQGFSSIYIQSAHSKSFIEIINDIDYYYLQIETSFRK